MLTLFSNTSGVKGKFFTTNEPSGLQSVHKNVKNFNFLIITRCIKWVSC